LCLQTPNNEDEWRNVADEFCQKWQFPHCVGSLDGKHVAIVAPANSGSLFYNYKHFFSIVLLALVDANYKFLYVDIGCYGRSADGGVFNNSTLSKALASNSLNIPVPEAFAGEPNLPYVIVADDAFALKSYIAKPYAMRGLTEDQRVFNYRLSRARRVVENAFGILVSRFRIFGKAIPLAPHKVEKVVMAACCLHNFLMRDSTSQTTYVADLLDSSDNFQRTNKLSQQGGNRSTLSANETRDKFCKYFNSSVGAVSWQQNICREA